MSNEQDSETGSEGTKPTGIGDQGRQLEFDRGELSSSQRRLDPLPNTYADADDDEPDEEYPDYEDEVADYELAPEEEDEPDVADEPAEWDEERGNERWYDDPAESGSEPTLPLPLGLILTGIAALILLGAGGYGVMQQRAELKEEIRQLRAELSTAASLDEVAAVRTQNDALLADNADLRQNLTSLERENRILGNTAATLEEQLAALQVNGGGKAPPRPAEPEARPEPKPEPVAAAKPAEPAPTKPEPTPASAGPWFVNFAAYGQEAAARSRADQLKPSQGQVTVSTVESGGRTLYRVRVVGLASESAAQDVARQLEQRYGLSKLWVGSD